MATEDHDDERPRLSAAPTGAAGATPATAPAVERTPARGVGRLLGFFQASWAELQRVRWPDRTQVGQGTGVVLVFVALAGLFLGGVDKAASEIVKFIV